MATNYEKGRSFEYRVKKVLEDAGYYVVRSASSQGVFDLVAMRGPLPMSIGVQCKHNCGLSITESMNLLLCKLEFGLDVFLAWSEKNGPLKLYRVTFEGLIEMGKDQG